MITFSQGGRLWCLQLSDGSLRSVTVSVPNDGKLTETRTVSAKPYLRENDTDYDVDYAFSADGRTAILDERGDLFRVPVNGSGAANLTATSNAEEDHPAVSTDGTTVADTIDSTGE